MSGVFTAKNPARLSTDDTGIGEPPLTVIVAPSRLTAEMQRGLPLPSTKKKTSTLPDGQTPLTGPLTVVQSICAVGAETVSVTPAGAVSPGPVPLIVPVLFALGVNVANWGAIVPDQVRVVGDHTPVRPTLVSVIVLE